MRLCVVEDDARRALAARLRRSPTWWARGRSHCVHAAALARMSRCRGGGAPGWRVWLDAQGLAESVEAMPLPDPIVRRPSENSRTQKSPRVLTDSGAWMILKI